MKKCPFCTRAVDQGASRCPHCDAALVLVLTPPRRQASIVPVVVALAAAAIFLGVALQYHPTPPETTPVPVHVTWAQKKSECSNNLRDIGVALEMYSHDNDGHYPEVLTELVPRYLKRMPRCPGCSDPDVYVRNYNSPDHTNPDGQPVVVDRCDARGHVVNIEGRGLTEPGADDARRQAP